MGKYEEALERARQGKPIDEAFEIVGHCDISAIIKKAIEDNIQ